MAAIGLDHRLSEIRRLNSISEKVIDLDDLLKQKIQLSNSSSSSSISSQKSTSSKMPQRFNPFDVETACAADEKITFFDLHEKYSQIFVPIFEQFALEAKDKENLKNKPNDADHNLSSKMDQTTTQTPT